MNRSARTYIDPAFYMGGVLHRLGRHQWDLALVGQFEQGHGGDGRGPDDVEVAQDGEDATLGGGVAFMSLRSVLTQLTTKVPLVLGGPAADGPVCAAGGLAQHLVEAGVIARLESRRP